MIRHLLCLLNHLRGHVTCQSMAYDHQVYDWWAFIYSILERILTYIYTCVELEFIHGHIKIITISNVVRIPFQLMPCFLVY